MFMYILLGLLILGIIAYVMNSVGLLIVLIILALGLIGLKIVDNIRQRH